MIRLDAHARVRAEYQLQARQTAHTRVIHGLNAESFVFLIGEHTERLLLAGS
jgi:hypothetical protein